MRVICQSVDEFLECLDNEQDILQNAIRVSITERPIDKGARDSIKFEIVLQASAVVNLKEGGQYLLEYGKSCGVDVRDADPCVDATHLACAIKDRIREYTKRRALKLLPGFIEI